MLEGYALFLEEKRDYTRLIAISVDYFIIIVMKVISLRTLNVLVIHDLIWAFFVCFICWLCSKIPCPECVMRFSFVNKLAEFLLGFSFADRLLDILLD